VTATGEAAAWSPRLFDDPRFAAVSDLLRLWPADRLPSVDALQDSLGARLAPMNLRIVTAPPPPPRRRKGPRDRLEIYELRIAATGEIPTRADNLHDVCNALSWAAFPRAKWALTCRIAELQKARLDATGALPSARDREHDRLALLDEGGLISLGDDRALDAELDGARGVIVGHALWQHAALGHRNIRAAVVALPGRAPRWSSASCDDVRAAVDAAWLVLVTAPERLHAAMADRAGEPIDEARLWQPAL
jgi:hypothetical protein